jgi:hypothetical protein
LDDVSLYEVRPGVSMPVKLEPLPGFPLAVGRGDSHELLLVTEDGIWARDRGTYTVLTRADYRDLSVSSVVEAENGTIYVGLALFVGRAVPEGGGFSHQWLAANESKRLDAEGACVIAAQPK